MEYPNAVQLPDVDDEKLRNLTKPSAAINCNLRYPVSAAADRDATRFMLATIAVALGEEWRLIDRFERLKRIAAIVLLFRRSGRKSASSPARPGS